MTLCGESYQKLFLRGYPVKLLIPVVIESSDELQDYRNQRKILENTVLLNIVQLYPLKLEYMQAFMKQMLLEFENRGIEVCGDWYEIYCNLLNRPSNKQDTHFKHFTIDDQENYVTIEESISCISQGTTGLCTWQASQTLVNWCTNNKDDIQNKCVVELGAGVGLAGLTICLKCIPKAYWLTDCHPSVLGMLLSNVKINVDREGHFASVLDINATNKIFCGQPEGERNVLYGGTLRNTSVYVMNLPWEDVPSSNIKPVICPDIVLAADVIYDSSSFYSLGNALHYLVSEKCVAVLACTIRNEETTNQFLDLLGKLQLTVEEILTEETENILDLRDVPVRVYKVKKDSIS